MTGEEATEANCLKTLGISICLQTMTNSFEYVENIVKSWIWFSKEGHPYSKAERTVLAGKLCAILEELENTARIKLPNKSEFKKLIYSDDIDNWNTIFLTVLPDIRGKLIDAVCKKLQALPRPLWSDLLPEVFANQVLPPFCEGQYLSAVRRGCDALRAVIRTKTGLHNLDSADLINQAYGKDRPFVVTVWEGHSEDDVRRGYTDMLRGAMMAIRNPHYHGTEELTEMEAARLLVMLGTLWARADSTTRA